MDILEWPVWIIGLVFVIGACGFAFVPYWVGRRVFHPRATEGTYDLSASILFRIGALHALILALMFAHEIAIFIELEGAVRDEAASTADVYYDLGRYDSEITEQIQQEMVSYVSTVVNEEWPLLKEAEMSGSAWQQWADVFNAILDLEPDSQRQADLRQFMLRDMEAIADFRENRQIGATGKVPAMFWVIALAGFFLVSFPFFVFEPSLPNVFLLGIYAVYNGLLLFVIFATDNPFGGPIIVEATPFVDVWKYQNIELLNGKT